MTHDPIRCPICRMGAAHRHTGIDPDPLYVEPQPVDRLPRAKTPDPGRVSSGLSDVTLGVATLAIVITLLAILAATLLTAAPRSIDQPSPAAARPTGAPLELARAQPAVAAVGGVSGTATWYCSPTSACTRGYPMSGTYAAAGSELQIPGWRGRWVLVCSGDRCVQAQLIDVCACAGRRVIDLYAGVFDDLAPLSHGVIPVRVAFLADADVALPATDTEERP